jgi:hypothetical protein
VVTVEGLTNEQSSTFRARWALRLPQTAKARKDSFIQSRKFRALAEQDWVSKTPGFVLIVAELEQSVFIAVYIIDD